MNNSDILAEIKAIQASAQNKRPWAEGGREQHDELLKKLDALDAKCRPGLNLGRLVSFSVADGYAYYVVSGIGPEIVQLEYIPVGDDYESVAVCDGKCFRKTVERMLQFAELYR